MYHASPTMGTRCRWPGVNTSAAVTWHTDASARRFSDSTYRHPANSAASAWSRRSDATYAMHTSLHLVPGSTGTVRNDTRARGRSAAAHATMKCERCARHAAPSSPLLLSTRAGSCTAAALASIRHRTGRRCRATHQARVRLFSADRDHRRHTVAGSGSGHADRVPDAVHRSGCHAAPAGGAAPAHAAHLRVCDDAVRRHRRERTGAAPRRPAADRVGGVQGCAPPHLRTPWRQPAARCGARDGGTAPAPRRRLRAGVERPLACRARNVGARRSSQSSCWHSCC